MWITLLSSHAFANQKVVLQLKWEHEFQFAGYYAALWQGYFEREGLDVVIRSAATPQGTMLSPIDELISGRADFAVGGVDVFLNRAKGHDIRVLAPIFQRSPGAIFTLPDKPIKTVNDLSALRIAAIPHDDTQLEARAMFFANGIDPDRVNFVDEPVTIQSLLDGKADAIVTYSISAKIRAQELGVDVNSLNPSAHGVQFYGDTLYTTGKIARDNPELAEKFTRAVLDGWRYALEHRSELAKRISNTLPRYIYLYDDLEAYNLAFAQIIDDYIFFPVVKLGHVDSERWQRTYDVLDRLGEIERPFEAKSLLFRTTSNISFELNHMLWSLIALLVVLIAWVSWTSGKELSWKLAVVILLVLVEQGMENWHRADLREQNKSHVSDQLNNIRSKIDTVISRNLAGLYSISAYIGANPNLSQKEFERYAETITKLDPQLINIAAAPDLVINYIYPLAGNEKALGLNYLSAPSQLPAVLRAIQSREPILAGPVDLVQGGQAFIGRAPVLVVDDLGKSTLWGIVSAPVDVASVYREAGLLDPDLTVRIAIRGRDSRGSEGDVFYGRADVFDDPEVVTQKVTIGQGSWQLGAVYVALNGGLEPRLLLIRFSSALVGLLLLLLLTTHRRNLASQKHYQSILRRHTEFLREVESVAKVGGWRIDSHGMVTEMSQHARSLLNLDTMEKLTIEQFVSGLYSPDQIEIAEVIRAALRHQRDFDIQAQSLNGQYWFRLIGDPSYNDNSEPEIVGAIQDITEKKIADAEIERQANFDPLTDLPNRALFRDRLETAIHRARRDGLSLPLLFVDLDNFKSINDNYGHRQGDLVLKETAMRIQGCLRASDTVGRHSGDEFTVILYDGNNSETADRVASKIVTELSRPFIVGGAEVFCGASIGIALYPDDAETADSLIVKADQAMYEVKKSGRNGWHFYTEEMQRRSEHRHQLYNDLVAAIRDDELSVYLQPIVEARTNKTVSCEALVRWQKADGTWVSPGDFIPLAEETGLVNQIDYLVMTKAAKALSDLNEHLETPIRLSINVSPRLFHTKDQALSRWLERVQKNIGKVPLTVEITERLLVDETDLVSEILHELVSYGVSISIDDFGTGYSSLSYLTRFPVSGLKIDQSFTQEIGNSDTAKPVIETILAMASKLNISVVAEGVETSDQLDYLVEQNCTYVQGYLLGRPMSLSDFESRLELENQKEMNI